MVAGVSTLIGILLGAGLNFYFTIAAEREKDLREIRRKAYVDFLHAQVKWDSAQYATSEEESRQFSEDFWNGLEALEAEISASGLLFTFKRRPVLDHVRVTAYTHEPRFVFHDFPSAGLSGELVGGWAHAAHTCNNYRDFNGFRSPTHRRVRPVLFGDKVLPGPILIALDIHNILPVAACILK